jgi:hypothetical protein
MDSAGRRPAAARIPSIEELTVRSSHKKRWTNSGCPRSVTPAHAPPGAVLAVSLVAAALLIGCSTGRYELDLGPPEATPPEAVIELWVQHRSVVVRALEGEDFTLRELRTALDFLATATCRPAHPTRSHLGPLPGDRLESDLRQWDEWLRENGQRLYVENDGETLGGLEGCQF